MKLLILCVVLSCISQAAYAFEADGHVGSALSISANFTLVSKQSSICVSQINQARANNGKRSVALHGQVEQAAYNHNAWMVRTNCFSHQCSGEPALGDRLSATGYRWSGVGEILAANSGGGCDGAVNQWTNSPGHNAIMLGDFAHVGCSGLICNNCQFPVYWTCVFANSF